MLREFLGCIPHFMNFIFNTSFVKWHLGWEGQALMSRHHLLVVWGKNCLLYTSEFMCLWDKNSSQLYYKLEIIILLLCYSGFTSLEKNNFNISRRGLSKSKRHINGLEFIANFETSSCIIKSVAQEPRQGKARRKFCFTHYYIVGSSLVCGKCSQSQSWIGKSHPVLVWLSMDGT